MLTRVARDVLRRTRFLSFTRITPTCATALRLPQNFEFHNLCRRDFSVFSKSPEYSEVPLMDLLTFESLCSETLESLTDYFEEIVEADPNLQNADIAYSVSLLKKPLSMDCNLKTLRVIVGWSTDCETRIHPRNLRYQPANTEPSNLAQFTNLRPKTI